MNKKMNDYDTIPVYPNLPKNSESFRLIKSCDILTRLEKEEKHYEGVRKKYSRVRNVTQNNICVGAGSLSIILSMSGLGTSLSGFGIVIGLPLGVIGGFCRLFFIISGTYSKRLGKKISHEQTVAFARSKINTIKDLISKVLIDEKISDEELSLIIKEVDKFEDLKLGIRQRFRMEEKKEQKKKVKVM